MLLPIAVLFASQAPTLAETTWPEDTARGISGLAHRGGTEFIAVPERVRELCPFEVDAKGVSPKPKIPLLGVTDGLDIESIAVLENGDVALGTEDREDDRTKDRILIGAFGPKGVEIKSELTFDYKPYGITAETNRGIEGLCFTDGRLVAAAEQAIPKGDRRFAMIQSYDFTEKRWAQYRLELTTSTGKISALSCQKTDRAREVFAIERHFEVSRILRFTLPLLDTGGEIKPSVVFDLREFFSKEVPNFEGIERLDDGRFLLISDNDYGGAKGPTHLILVKPKEK
jgi:hypothetical protein